MVKTKLYSPIKSLKQGNPIINLIDPSANKILEYDPQSIFSVIAKGQLGTSAFTSKGSFYYGEQMLPVLFAGELPKKILKVQLKITYEDE